MNQAKLTYDFLERPASLLRGNVTLQVTEIIRNAIVSLQLEPGRTIDKPALCAHFQVSRSPVSEALARLQNEGLVDILPQRGSVVSRIRVAEVSQYFLIRRALETEAISVLTGQYGADELAGLEHILHQQHQAAREDAQTLFHQLDRDFHARLYAGSRLDRVRDAIHAARANLDRAQHLINSPRRLTDIIEEHHAIFNAVKTGDPQAAAKAMRTHIESTTAQFFSFAQTHPQMFIDGRDPQI